MIEYWRVMGRVVTEEKFLKDLYGKFREHETRLDQVPDLWSFLVGEGYRLSRWETMELNRVLGRIRKEPDPVEGLQNSWTWGEPTDPAHRLIGALCIDHVYRNEVYGKCQDGPTLKTHLDGHPAFRLQNLAEAGNVAAFVRGSKTELKAMEKILWVVTDDLPVTSCWNGFSIIDSDYDHVNPVVISAWLKMKGLSATELTQALLTDRVTLS